MPQKIWLNGNLVAPQDAVVNVYDHGLLYGDGVFEGIRCYNRRVFKLATHLERLFQSARAIRLEIPYTREALATACRETVAACERTDCYIRLCVTRGEGLLGLNPFNCKRPNVIVIVDSIALYPAEMYENGMAIITASTMRNHPAALSPRIKSMNYLNNILAKIEAIDAGVSEAVMLNHLGYVAECTGDNIFIVRKLDSEGRQPVLITPPLHAGVLEGVTLGTVVCLAQQGGIKVLQTDITRHDLYVCDEMFLTGTAAEVVPVTCIDRRTIGNGKPGPITRQLMTAFRTLVKDNASED